MNTPYRAPPWLPGGHLQTIWPVARAPAVPAYTRERWDTPDGDFIDTDWLPSRPGAPLVVLFHGLEGCSSSHYARATMQVFGAAGWNGVVPNFRGCSGTPNRLLRAYHSGDSAEIDWILERIAARHHPAPVYAAGVSLGGNALLKWLGEQGAAACTRITAAAAVCPPLDLEISGHALGEGFNRLYSARFLRTLKTKALAKVATHAASLDVARIRNATSLYAFDDAFTAPVHGFDGVLDYWRRASSRPWLNTVHAPTLLLNARNDPFVPPAALPRQDECGPSVRIEFPADGGHVGFLAGAFPGHIDWMPNRLLHFFNSTAAGTESTTNVAVSSLTALIT